MGCYNKGNLNLKIEKPERGFPLMDEIPGVTCHTYTAWQQRRNVEVFIFFLFN
jgi:hypothetical protein